MDIRRYRMPDWRPSKTHYSRLTADPFDPVESSQISRRDLTRSSFLVRVQCSVSEKRASRRTQDSSCDTRNAHGNNNHLPIISARSLEPKPWPTAAPLCMLIPSETPNPQTSPKGSGSRNEQLSWKRRTGIDPTCHRGLRGWEVPRVCPTMASAFARLD